MPTPTDMAKKNNTVEGVLPTNVLLLLTLEEALAEEESSKLEVVDADVVASNVVVDMVDGVGG